MNCFLFVKNAKKTIAQQGLKKCLAGQMTVQPLLMPTNEDAHGGSCDWILIDINKLNLAMPL